MSFISEHFFIIVRMHCHKTAKKGMEDIATFLRSLCQKISLFASVVLLNE